MDRYKVGKFISIWGSKKDLQNLTFIVTEDCNLRCKYCYLVHKKPGKELDFETAKKFIDNLVMNPEKYNYSRSEAVILDFFGGEPTLKMSLIDQICDYFKKVTFENNISWWWNYRINICSNGVKFLDEDVQSFLKKNDNKISYSITLDGTKEKHDLQRVFCDGRGSYDEIIKGIPHYIKTCAPTTKVTFASDDLPLLASSIIHLFNLGFIEIAANVVFEDVWKENDEFIFENQLKILADYILDNQLYDKFTCTLFNDRLGYFSNEEDYSDIQCGTGKMLALDGHGNIFSCQRFKEYSLSHQKEWSIGNVDEGINLNKIRPFYQIKRENQLDNECLNCPIALDCSDCLGFAYDTNGDIFSKSKFICKMHKARVRANDYYFSKLFNMYGIEREKVNSRTNRIFFVFDKLEKIDKSKIEELLSYARDNFCSIYFLVNERNYSDLSQMEFNDYLINYISNVEYYEYYKDKGKVFWITEGNDLESFPEYIYSCFLTISQKEINNLSNKVISSFENFKKVNLFIKDIDDSFDADLYKSELVAIAKYLKDTYQKDEKIFKYQFDVLTDSIQKIKNKSCGSGWDTFFINENGKIYKCLKEVNNDSYSPIGTINQPIEEIRDKRFDMSNSNPLCKKCEAIKCSGCSFLNEKYCNDKRVSPDFICKKTMIETKIAKALEKAIIDNGEVEDYLSGLEIKDPIIGIKDDINSHVVFK